MASIADRVSKLSADRELLSSIKSGTSKLKVDELKAILKSLSCNVPCKATKAELLKLIGEELMQHTPQITDFVYDKSECKVIRVKDCDIKTIVQLFENDNDVSVIAKKTNLCITQDEAKLLHSLADINNVWGFEMAEPPEKCKNPEYEHHTAFHHNASAALKGHMRPLVEPIYHASDASGGPMRCYIYKEYRPVECFQIDETDKMMLMAYLSCPDKNNKLILNLIRKLATRPLATCTLGMAVVVVQARCLLVSLVSDSTSASIHDLHESLKAMADATERHIRLDDDGNAITTEEIEEDEGDEY